jgi:AcrR family transcriptional regulator
MKIPNDTTAIPSARERILASAHRLFYAEGIRATGVDRVIAESGVTKVTFYRHFPSKNDLVCAYLECRHQRWIDWFEDALRRHAAKGGAPLDAAAPALAEWLRDEGFRGCAFLNGVGELGTTLPAVVEITRRHKQDMTDAIARLLPPSRYRARLAQAAAMAVDGAIVRAQFDESPEPALKLLGMLLKALAAEAA